MLIVAKCETFRFMLIPILVQRSALEILKAFRLCLVNVYTTILIPIVKSVQFAKVLLHQQHQFTNFHTIVDSIEADRSQQQRNKHAAELGNKRHFK